MDISQFNLTDKANEGAFMQLRHPGSDTPILNEDGTKVGITLLGYDSDICRRQRNKSLNKSLNRRKQANLTAEEVRERVVKNIAQCGVDWQGFEKDGKPLKFSKEALEELLREHEWIKEQCDAFIGEREHFLPLGLKD